MKRLPGLVCTLVLVTTAAGTAWAQGATDTAAIETQIVANERAANAAFAKGDVKAFRMLVGDSIGIDAAMGVMSASDYGKMITQVKIEAWSMEDPRVHWLSPDVALITYLWRGRGTFQGQPLPTPTYASSIWVKQNDGRWIGRFHQETAAMLAPGAAEHQH